MTPALLFCAHAALASPEILAVQHLGTWNGDTISWVTEIRLDGPAQAHEQIAFAVPLPPEASLTLPPGIISILDERGQVVAIELTDWQRGFDLASRQSARAGEVILLPPIPVTGAPQRLEVDGAQLTANTALGLERGLVRTVHPAITRESRRQLDRQLGTRTARPGTTPLYLLADTHIREAGGVPVHLQLPGAVSSGVAFAVGGIFLAVLGLLAIGHRLLGRLAQLEHVEAYIEKEFLPMPGPKRSAPGPADVAP